MGPELAITLLKKRIEEANEILPHPSRDQLQTWVDTTVDCIQKAFGKGHRNVGNFLEQGQGSGQRPWGKHQWQVYRYRMLEAKIAALRGYIEELVLGATPQTAGAAEKPSVFVENRPLSVPTETRDVSGLSKKVFIVHGHDGELKEATARLVAQLGLEPVILHERARQGRTIIENFSIQAKESAFAIVLLTADDVGSDGTIAKHSPLRARARQNVVFEMGFFFSSLGRDRVCAVYEEGIELPSDLGGILYVQYDRPGKWRIDVAKEIKVAGHDVDLNRIL
jgi:predicted nucleotide-binding protein